MANLQRFTPGKYDLAKLLPVSLQPIGDQEVNAVSARALYGQLGLNLSQWSRWYAKNILKNRFAEAGRDWSELDIMSSSNPANPKSRPRETKDFFLAVPFAKKLAMAAQTPEGEMVRDYFLACEEKAQSQGQVVAKMLSGIADTLDDHTKCITLLHTRLESFECAPARKTSPKGERVSGALLQQWIKLYGPYRAQQMAYEAAPSFYPLPAGNPAPLVLTPALGLEEPTTDLALLPAPTAQVPEKSIRAAINEVVRGRSVAAEQIHERWHTLYRQAYYRMGVDLVARGKRRGMSPLAVAEADGLLAPLYTLACELFGRAA